MITDHQVNWLRKRDFKTYWELLGVISNTDITAQGDGVISALVSGGAGPTFDLAEISTSGIVTLGSATDGADVALVWKIPTDFDVNWSLGMKFFVVGAGTVTFTPTMVYRICKSTEDITTAPATVLDTIFTGVSCTASTLRVSNRGIINRLALSRSDVENGAFLVTNVNWGLSGATRVGMLGIEFDYAPQYCAGQGNEIDPPLAAGSV